MTHLKIDKFLFQEILVLRKFIQNRCILVLIPRCVKWFFFLESDFPHLKLKIKSSLKNANFKRLMRIFFLRFYPAFKIDITDMHYLTIHFETQLPSSFGGKACKNLLNHYRAKTNLTLIRLNIDFVAP